MALGTSSLAGAARVSYEAVGLADFANDNARAEQSYRNATQGMSSDAIRLELAQDKLRRAIAKGPAAYREQARAELNLRSVQDSLRHSTDSLDRSQDAANRSMGRFSRGALAGSGAFRGMARSIAFASSAFLGGAGFVYAIRTSINAAIEQDKILANLRNSLAASGFSWEKYGAQIQVATQKTKALSAFDDEELYQSLQLLIRGTGDVTKALELNSLATDVARGRGKSLETVSVALLKAYNGQTAGLARLGIVVDKTASKTEILQAVQRKYAGAAEAFGESAAGATARFQVGLGDLEKAIGRGVLPQFTLLVNKAADWLNQSENQARVQRDVTEAVAAGEKAVRGLTAVLGPMVAGLKGISDALGGLQNTVELVLIGGIVYKGLKAVAAIRGLAASFGLIAPAATRAAATTVVAENAIGTGALVQIPKIAALRAELALLGGVSLGAAAATAGVITAGIVGGVGVVKGLSEADQALGLSTSPSAKKIASIMERQGDAGIWRETWSNMSPAMRSQVAAELKRRGRVDILAAVGVKVSASTLRGVDASDRASAESSGGPGRTSGGRPRRTLADIELDIARPGNEVGDLREKRSFIQRQIDALERRKKLTVKQKADLTALYGQLASTQSQLDAIATAGEQKIEDQRQKARENRQRQRDEAQRRLDAWNARAEAQEKRIARSNAPRPGGRSTGTGEGFISRVRRGEGAKDKPGGGITEEQVRSMQFEFLSRLTGDIGQFGSNFESDSGQIATQSHIQTSLLSQQNAALQRLIEGAWHPGAQLASAELSAAGWGVGF